MNEKKSRLTSIRSWWLAIPGGFFGIVLALFFIAYSANTYLRYYDIIGSSLYVIVLAFAFAIPFSRGHADFSALGVFNICSVMLGVLNRGLPFVVAAILAICIGGCLGFINSLVTIQFRRKKWFFTAGFTAILGLAYTYFAELISGGRYYRISAYLSGGFCFFALILPLMLGLSALLSFRSGGVHLFNGIYRKNDFRNKDAMVSSVISGVLAAFAAVIAGMCISRTIAFPYTQMLTYILILALAGVGLPNVKKSKIGAFMGYLSVMLAALGIGLLDSLLYVIFGLGTIAQIIIDSVLAVAFIVLNVLLGRKAAKIEYTPELKTVSGAYETAVGYRSNVNTDDPYEYTGKSKITAMMLSIFLGPLGVHRYYLGYKGQGFAQTCGVVSLIIAEVIVNVQNTKRSPSVGAVIFALILLIYGLAITIWAFVDFIRICTRSLTPVVDEYFYRSITRRSYLSDNPVSNNTTTENTVPKVSLTKPEETTTVAPNAVSAPESKMDAMEQVKALTDLAELYKNGIISEEDFNRLKNNILSKM